MADNTQTQTEQTVLEGTRVDAMQQPAPELPPKPDLTKDLDQLRAAVSALDKKGNTLFLTSFEDLATGTPIKITDIVQASKSDPAQFKAMIFAMDDTVLETYRERLAITTKELKAQSDATQGEILDLSDAVKAVQQKDPTLNLSNFRVNIASLEKNFKALHKWAVAGEQVVKEVDGLIDERKIEKIRNSLGLPPEQNAA
jgi:hypothetical protein